jgi:cyclophilin family peptidyl-prolyl cis-trans isomerase
VTFNQRATRIFEDNFFIERDFMIQGGGFDKTMTEKPTKATIKNEATNGKKNEIGTLAMARTSEVDCATAQFFINVSDNAFLDHKNDSERGFGYAVFGKIISGMPVVNKIKMVKTTTKTLYQDVPTEPVVILDIVKNN